MRAGVCTQGLNSSAQEGALGTARLCPGQGVHGGFPHIRASRPVQGERVCLPPNRGVWREGSMHGLQV